MADYYKILGVSPSSSSNEIERAFYKLKAKFSSTDTEDPYFKNFYRRILEAHNVLSNNERRAQYDKIYRSEEVKFDNKEDIKLHSIEPVIEYFKTSKTLIDEGEKIILSWKTSMADEVILMPTGKVEIIGLKIIHFEDLVKNRTRFSLRVVNHNSGKEATQDIFIEKTKNVSEIRENNPERLIGTSQVNDTESVAPTKSLVQKKDNYSQSNIKKYGVPSGVGVLLIAIILFAIEKSGFWESSSQSIIEESFPITNIDSIRDTKNNNISKEEIFIEKSLMLNGKIIQYYDAELVFNELFSEIEKYSIPNMTGFTADVKQFFNSSDNPIEWRNINSNEYKLKFNSKINVGITQQPYSEERNLVLEELNLLKIGTYDTSLLSILEFEIKDSGPPFWEPNEKWEAFQRVFNSKFDKVILTDELNIIKEIYSLNQISSGKSKGYIIMNNGLRIPVSFSKAMTQDQPTTFKIIEVAI